jgi:hypothetical protein
MYKKTETVARCTHPTKALQPALRALMLLSIVSQ